MEILLFFWGAFILFTIYAIVSSRRDANKHRMREDEIRYHELNQKQYERGTNASSLSTAKDALWQLESGYDAIKDNISSNSRWCYQMDIEDVRSNVEDIALEKWQEKAEKILDEFIAAYVLITNPTFADVEKAYRAKDKCIRKYDAYWEWTQRVHDENAAYFSKLNLWDEARNMFRERFCDNAEPGDHAMLVWGMPGSTSTRENIKKKLSECIRTMEPEYRKKMTLESKIMQRIADHGSIQRSVLLKSSFDGFVDAEIKACYRGIVNRGRVVEVKQGRVYFVSLSDKEKKK